jgi:transposase-like protein
MSKRQSIFQCPKPTDKVLRLMERGAELRARGLAWVAVAEKLERPNETIQQWVKQYREVWQGLLREAEGRVFREAGAEALQMLRKLLRSKDEKVTRDVARTLATLLCRYPYGRGADEPAMDETTQHLLEVAKALHLEDFDEHGNLIAASEVDESNRYDVS